MRIMHESSLYLDNMFITLTYNKENLPADYGLVKRDFQLFIKRYRKKIYPIKLRYYMCGEYGDENGRPHYHAIIFNHRFTDLKLIEDNGSTRRYQSQQLTDLWELGDVNEVGEVNFQSAAYLARYIIKKRKHKNIPDQYLTINEETGELYNVQKEYANMSTRPGIGRGWIDQYAHSVYANDSIIINGKEVTPPKYYDKVFEQNNKEKLLQIKKDRKIAADKNPDNNSKRRKVLETIARQNSKQLKRKV